MGKISSEEIESQYNLIKMLLAEPEKYKDAINAIKKNFNDFQKKDIIEAYNSKTTERSV